MANSKVREELRGVEVETLDLIAEVVTSEEWSELLAGPLSRAARQGNRGLAQKLMRSGADLGDALHAAVCGVTGHGHGEIVTDLLDRGATLVDKDEDGHTPLHYAAMYGNTEMVRMLLSKGADEDARGSNNWTPLYVAAWNDRMGAALALLTAGADPNLLGCGVDNESAVHIAAEKGSVGVLRVVIEHGADVHTRDKNKRTPLHQAAKGNQIEAIEVLLEAGANVEARDCEGTTPLDLAAGSCKAEAVGTLLKLGADINVRDHHDRTPLFCTAAMAGAQGAADVMDLLLRSGADETITDDEGKTPADVVGMWFTGDAEEDTHVEDVARARRLLANAPADRSWRRRGYLILCRAHPDRVHQGQESSSGHDAVTRITRSAAKLSRANFCRDNSGRVGNGDGDNSGGDWAGVVARVLSLREQGIFRTIVGYL